MSSRTANRIVVWVLAMPAVLLAREDADLPEADAVQPQLFATGFELADGLAFDAKGSLYVTNYRGNGNIGRITRDGTASVWAVLSEIAPLEGRVPRGRGMKVDREGRLLVADAGGGRLLRISSDGRRGEVLADRFNGERFAAVSDLALDTRGNVFFVDAGKSDQEEPTGSVYRFDIATGAVSRLVTGLAAPGGLAITPDQTRVCVGETGRHRLLMFNLVENEATNETEIISFSSQDTDPPKANSVPQGMIFDTSGRLYIAMGAGGVVSVINVDRADLIRQYSAGGQVTSCHFFDGHLYTTIVDKEAVFRLPLGVNGFRYNPQ